MATTYAYNSPQYAAGVNLWGFWSVSASKWSQNLAPNYISALNDGYAIEFVGNCTQAQIVVFANNAQTLNVSVDGGAVGTVTAGTTGTQTLTLATGLSAGNHLFRVSRGGSGITFADIILTGGTEALTSVAKAQAYFNKSALAASPLYPSATPISVFSYWGAHKAFSTPAQAIAMSEYNSCIVEGRFTGSGLGILAFYDSNMHIANGIDTGPAVDTLFAPGGVSGQYGWTTLAAALADGTHRFREYMIGGSAGNSIWAGIRCTNARVLASDAGSGTNTLVLDSAPTGWAIGHWLYIGYEGNVGNGEVRQISNISGATITLSANLTSAHVTGVPVWNYCDPEAGSFIAVDESIGTTSDPTDLTKIYHPPNGKVVALGDSITQQKSTDLTGGGPYTPVYITYDDRFSFFRRYAITAGLDLINLSHQGDATANMVSRDADFATMNTSGCEQWGMLIGTNDCNTSVSTSTYATNLGTIIDAFVAGAPANSVILVSKLFTPTNHDVTGYNAQIDSVVATKQTANPDYLIKAVDIATTAGMVLNTNAGGDLFDTLHPNNQGAAKMASVMAGLFASAAPGEPDTPDATTGNVQIVLVWDAVSQATSYKLRRDGIVIFTGNALTYTDSVTAGSTHSYTIAAVNGVGESDESSARTITANAGNTTTPGIGGTVSPGDTIAVQRGDTVVLVFTDLGNIPSSRDKLWFTIKRHYNDLDSESVVQVEETDGLLYLNGVAAEDATQASLTVSDLTAGNLSVTLSAAVSSALPLYATLYYDIQYLDGTTIRTLTAGVFTATPDVTRAVS